MPGDKEMSVSLRKCPICGNIIRDCTVDNINLDFLEERVKDGKINAAISLARIIWNNNPRTKVDGRFKSYS